MVALQEVTRSAGVDQARDWLGPAVDIVDHPNSSDDGVGACLVSRHPLEQGHTFTPTNPLVRAGQMPLERGRRIDHIMVRSGPHGPLLDVAACRLLFDAPVHGVWASDHFAVLADLVPPPHRPGEWAPGWAS